MVRTTRDSQWLSVAARTYRFWLAFGLFASVSVALRWPFLSYPLNEAHAFRQMQTTLMIREFTDRGLLQISPLPLFGPPWQLPLEFPAFQWIAALLGQMIGTTPQLAGRGTALLSFLASAVMLAWLVRRWYSESAAIVTLALFLFLPFGFQWSIAPLIEFFAVALGLLGLIGLVRFLDVSTLWMQGVWLFVALVGACGVFLVKVTSGLPFSVIYLSVLVAAFCRDRPQSANKAPKWSLAVAPLVVAVLMGYLWTRYADAVKGSSPYTRFATSSELSEWNFGSLNQRLDMQFLSKIFEYSAAITGGTLVFIILGSVALARGRSPAITVGLILSVLVTPLVFFNLYYLHNYYLSAIYAPMVALMGVGVTCLTGLARSRVREVCTTCVVVGSILLVAWTSPEGVLVSQRKIDGIYSFPLAAELAAVTDEGDGIALVGCDWDPAYFFLSGRRGLMLRAEDEELGIPSEWILNSISHIARCDPNRDLSEFIPRDVKTRQVSPNVFEFLGPER